MDELTRRHALKIASAAGLLLGAKASAQSAGAAHNGETETAKTDRDFVLAAGMTEAEADCWAAAAACAGAFFALPELHPLDGHEVAQAIHVIQNKLLSRPTYRTYLKHAKGE